jgi:ubiquinone/menaquinone biosynthesis C-methylase UbiE
MKKVEYKVLDKVADYNPDIVGDIHKLPLADNSVDAIICMSVLKHVEEPQQAVREMYRVLKPGGYCYIYVPFLFYYHPMPGYYGDFYRFTVDGCRYMARDFSTIETHNARGAIATVFNLFPFFSKKVGFFEFLDRLFGKTKSNQTSGYHVFCIK